MTLVESPRVMPFDPAKVSFGRHETFPLRYSWLPKGFQALQENPKVFEYEDATVVLGVGKNMVHSIRHWMRATRVAELTSDGLEPTKLGQAILGDEGWDPYLEDEATIWLFHWLLATNPGLATAWYWFFNRFHKPEFTSPEVAAALQEFAKENITAKHSVTTLKQDAAVLLRMYTPSKGNTKTPVEDALDSPLSTLKLVSYFSTGRTYHSKPERRDSLPVGVFGFVVTELFNAQKASELPIDYLMYGKSGLPAPGSVFRLTESALLALLEGLVDYLPGAYELRETAGIHQLYRLREVDSFDYLGAHYEAIRPEIAA